MKKRIILTILITFAICFWLHLIIIDYATSRITELEKSERECVEVALKLGDMIDKQADRILECESIIVDTHYRQSAYDPKTENNDSYWKERSK